MLLHHANVNVMISAKRRGPDDEIKPENTVLIKI